MASKKSWLWDSSANIPRSTLHSRRKRDAAHLRNLSTLTEQDFLNQNHIPQQILDSRVFIQKRNTTSSEISTNMNESAIPQIEDFLSDDPIEEHLQLTDDIVCEDSFSEESLDSESELNDETNEFLCNKALDFTTLVECYIQRYRLSEKATDSLLQLLQQSFTLTEAEKSKIPKSVHLLKKRSDVHEKFGTKLGWICKQCHRVANTYFSDRKTPNNYSYCLNCSVTAEANDDYFITISLEKTLKFLLTNNKNMETAIANPGCTHDNNSFQDICCGSVYKNLHETLKNECSLITLLINTDGVPVFHSSKCSVWPILATVNELRPVNRKNSVLCLGLWFGKEKPNFESFLSNFNEEMKRLSTTGLSWNFNNTIRLIKVFCIGCTSDSVARPILQNMIQFNGQFGCQCCLHPGSSVPKKNGHMWAYNPDIQFPLRSEVENDKYAIKAKRSNTAFNGVKGKSTFKCIPNFSVIQNFPIDYMHNVLLGVVKTFTKLWFDPAYSSFPFSMVRFQSSVDFHLLNIFPNNLLARTPRSITDISYWKAHEWRNWLLFYSPVILKRYLEKSFYDHWCILSYVVHKMSRAIVKHSDITECRELLNKFACLVKTLYGIEYCTYNVHILIHLCDDIERYGPIFGFSLFTYENFNQILLQSQLGTQAVPSQMIQCYLKDLVLQQVQFDENNPFSDIFIKYYGSHTKIVQKPKPYALSEIGLDLNDISPLVSGQEILDIVTYDRLRIKHFTIHGTQYKRPTKRDSSAVFLLSGSVLIVNRFIEIQSIENKVVCAIGNLYETVDPKFTETLNFTGHIEKQCDPGLFSVIPVERIQEPAIVIRCSNATFYAKLPNTIEYRD